MVVLRTGGSGMGGCSSRCSSAGGQLASVFSPAYSQDVAEAVPATAALSTLGPQRSGRSYTRSGHHVAAVGVTLQWLQQFSEIHVKPGWSTLEVRARARTRVTGGAAGALRAAIDSRRCPMALPWGTRPAGYGTAGAAIGRAGPTRRVRQAGRLHTASNCRF